MVAKLELKAVGHFNPTKMEYIQLLISIALDLMNLIAILHKKFVSIHFNRKYLQILMFIPIFLRNNRWIY
jgi:hypothetical protein